MLITQDCGTRHLRLWTLAPPSHKVVGSFSMQDALSLGPPNFNPKLHSPPPKLSTFQCHKLWGTSFLSWDYCRKWVSKVSKFFAMNLMCIARFLRTTLVPSNWQDCPSFALGPSTSMCVTIISVSMFERVSSRSSLSILRIRLPMPSPNCWHKTIFNVNVVSCAAGNLHKQPKWGSVTYWVLWYLFLGIYLSRSIVIDLDQSWSAQLHQMISYFSSWQNVLFHRAQKLSFEVE